MEDPLDRSPVDAHPWYRYFWPWFLIGLLSFSILGSISLLVIAIRNPDPLVSDDWYQKGKGINQALERDHVASSMGLAAELSIDDVTGDVSLVLTSDEAAGTQPITLKLEHPTRADLDQRVVLRWVDHLQRFQGALDQPLRGRWYAMLSPELEDVADSQSSSWRLKQTITAPLAGPTRFGNAR
ncbi:MAG: FixH family protein [Deltaproteobacteria bacterium]|nr:FixH family protein [Deltaproteobacteria bacterium]